jgi:hypothetical protein
MATQLLRYRTRWRPRERPALLRAAAPRRGNDATATRLLCLRTRWRPRERQAMRRRSFLAIGEVTANIAAARSRAVFNFSI